MDFRALGPIQLRGPGGWQDAGPPQQSCVLGVLLVEAGRIVPVDLIVDRVWGTAAPEAARRTLHSYVTRLRRMVEQVPGAAIVRRSGGYVLDIVPDRVDLHRGRRLRAEAREPGRSPAERAALLREAVELWRGEPLAGLSGEWVGRTREALRQERLDGTVAWARAEIDGGDPGAVLTPLSQLVAEHPLAESPVAVLMRAFCAVGRVTDALDCYAAARQRLLDELGVDPGAELQAMHRAALRGELDPPAGPPPAPVVVRNVPAQLPMDVYGFTGRDAEIATLDALFSPADGQPNAVRIAAVSGTAGVGKTALAVHWAHRVADEFPDGQLYVNLRGYDPEQPVTPGDALAGFLAALGLAGRDVPLEVDGRAARFRSEVAGRRMLIVLDNAASVEQIRPLLPGSATCLVVVTSRDSLAGLVALHGARRVDLDLLESGDAMELLRGLLRERVDAEPDAARLLADSCARLPLALRVAAELVAARPATPLSDLSRELGEQRLELLDAGGDDRGAVRAVFSWSYQHLPADAARAFRMVGLHPGADFDAYAVAALTGADLGAARRWLGTLARVHLLHAAGPGRYGMHDLLRAYAAELAAATDPEDARRAALTRLFDYYLATAGTAMDVLYPAERDRRPPIPEVGTPVPPMSDAAAARLWLENERPSIVAVAAHTVTHGWWTYPTRLSGTLWRYFDWGGHFPDAVTVSAHALRAARLSGDRAAEANALSDSAGVYGRLARFKESLERYEAALELFRLVGDRLGEARALTNSGLIHAQTGQYPQAVPLHEQAVELFRALGDAHGESRAWGNLGVALERKGEYDRATECQERSLALARQVGDPDNEAVGIVNLGLIASARGDYDRAVGYLKHSVAIFAERGSVARQAEATSMLGVVYGRQGRWEMAVEGHQRAASLLREIGDRFGEVRALNGLGEALRASGYPDKARQHYEAALAIAVEIGTLHEEARAYDGLAHTWRADDPERAFSLWKRALDGYTAIGAPEAPQVRALLAE
ncbi:XRE family transcriptional regulator [Virgisporangium aliadipatigenens]|uniref:XRE family transcriptional regulator n=1 Tax=Virgisporangium aliadipatigenens TaxID=741659 RepID=A0A8J3YSU9_9ACTN|nr:tetratricopeptide repeat protein [Virgisporangium aliadipatigenens]GIJ50881.1 XRE family transcriptional regulator [Virgisporangium aliadipatigenens]